MQAILVLYFADTVAPGGMGMSAGTAFLSLALANGIQAQAVKLHDDVSQPAYFGVNGAIAVVAGLAVMAATRWLRHTTHPVH